MANDKDKNTLSFETAWDTFQKTFKESIAAREKECSKSQKEESDKADDLAEGNNEESQSSTEADESEVAKENLQDTKPVGKRENFFRLARMTFEMRSYLKDVETEISAQLDTLANELSVTYVKICNLVDKYDLSLRYVESKIPKSNLLNKDFKRFRNIAKGTFKLVNAIKGYRELLNDSDPKVLSELFKSRK